MSWDVGLCECICVHTHTSGVHTRTSGVQQTQGPFNTVLHDISCCSCVTTAVAVPPLLSLLPPRLPLQVVAERHSVLVFCAGRAAAQSCATMLSQQLPKRPGCAPDAALAAARADLVEQLRVALSGSTDPAFEKLLGRVLVGPLACLGFCTQCCRAECACFLLPACTCSKFVLHQASVTKTSD